MRTSMPALDAVEERRGEARRDELDAARGE